MKKIRIAVLMGGKSPEYEISIISGREVVRHLNKCFPFEDFEIIFLNRRITKGKLERHSQDLQSNLLETFISKFKD